MYNSQSVNSKQKASISAGVEVSTDNHPKNICTTDVCPLTKQKINYSITLVAKETKSLLKKE